MYLTAPTDRYWIIDIETDGLDPTVIWVLCAINVVTGEEVVRTDYDTIRLWFAERQAEGCVFIGHNIIGFDVPVLNRLVGTRIGIARLIDTFVTSSVYSPSLAGGHSLEAWGQRLGTAKGSWNDWSKLSDGMVDYCLRDCRVNLLLFNRLRARMGAVGFSERSLEIEHRAWALTRKQQRNGFQLDIPAAHALLAEIRELERQLKEEIYEQWPPELIEVKRFAKHSKSDGQRTANYLRHAEQYPRLVDNDDGGYVAFDFVEFNLGSPKQRIAKLLELGWKPKEFTPKGSPQATRKGNLVPSLEQFIERRPNGAVRKLAEWIAVNARGNMVSSWLDIADGDGLIHGGLWLAGTLRYRHDKPNTANIPAVRIKKDGDGRETIQRGREGGFTYEARDLWVTRDRENRRLVGVDAKGVQLRILAHYLGNPEYADAVVSGDPHEYTRSITKVGTRAANKNFLYAYILGAQAAKVGELLGVSTSRGRDVMEMFVDTFPGFKGLQARIQGEVKRTGRLQLCDGARSLVPEPRLALAYLLQGDESRIMKQSAIIIDEQVRKLELDAIKVGDIHDEFQTDVVIPHVDPFVELCYQTFPEVGKSFNYTVPIACDAKVGITWSETH